MGVCHTPVQSHLSPHPTCSALKGKKCVKAGGWLLQHLVTVVCLVDILYTIACVRGYISSPASNCPMLEETALCLLLLLLQKKNFGCQLCQGGGVLVCVRDEILWTGKELWPSATAGGDGNECAAHGVAGLLLVRGVLAQRPCSVFRCTCWLLH